MLCRICKLSDCVTVIDLGEQVITSRFPVYRDFSTPRTRISLFLCNTCGLLQLEDSVAGSELYEHEYGYCSGISNTMREHLRLYNQELRSKVVYVDGDEVLDIGSNDATFLKNYPESLHRVGIDPTGKQFSSCYEGLELIPTYFTRDNIGTRKFKSISSISMFYDLPDPVQFARDIYGVLDDEGVWTLEQSYVVTMLERNSIDTICHEHIEYYGVSQVKRIMDEANLKIIDISLNECNGGSFRLYVAKRSSAHVECIDLIRSYQEKELYLRDVNTYVKFMERCKLEADKLNHLISMIHESGKTMYVYGASTKGNCLLQYANITEDRVPYAVERNPSKVGKMTSTGIPIISEETMRENPPDYQLVLPWHFKTEILQRESTFLANGGQFVFPFPILDIVSKKPKLLVTGLHGQIGSYIREIFSNEYQICDIGSPDVSTSDFKQVLDIYNPSAIVHLAGMSNTEECEANPARTLAVNGVSTATICEWIATRSPKTRLFNASSSEIFKGHGEYTVHDDDTSLSPITIYAISKSLGHNIVNYYRTTKGIHASNGILFTTESFKRKPSFLLKKIALHAASWDGSTPLSVGNIDSFRCVTHARDTADAIYRILRHDVPNNYVVCACPPASIRSMVERIYSFCGIKVSPVDQTTYVVDGTNTTVFQTGAHQRGPATRIQGSSDRLTALGWIPRYNLDAILQSIVNDS